MYAASDTRMLTVFVLPFRNNPIIARNWIDYADLHQLTGEVNALAAK